MPQVPALALDETNRRFVAAVLREHVKGGTMPPRWTRQQLIDRATALGLTIRTAPAGETAQ